jgi:hypothetical protein
LNHDEGERATRRASSLRGDRTTVDDCALRRRRASRARARRSEPSPPRKDTVCGTRRG